MISALSSLFFFDENEKKNSLQKLILQSEIKHADKCLILSVCLQLLLSWILWSLIVYFCNVFILILTDSVSSFFSDFVSSQLSLFVIQTELLLMKKFLKLYNKEETLQILKYIQNLQKDFAERLAEQNHINFH